MKLKRILKDIEVKEIKGSKDIEITGVCSDSRRVFPGNLFIARKGLEYDAADFIPDAVSAGAVAIVTDLYNPFLDKIVQVIHEDPASIEADLAANYFEYPSKQLFMIGITGTNGKTTTSYLIKQLLDNLQKPSGLIGSIEYNTGLQKHAASKTTPDSVTNQKLLKEMLLNDCKACVMEVTSHGLMQKRVKNIDFDVAIFTHLTQDHLDYHHSMDEYLQAKKILFDSLSEEKWAVVNADSEHSGSLTKNIKAKIFSYGIEKPADLQAMNISTSISGTTFDVVYQNQTYSITSPLVGIFNVYNVLAAIAAVILAGFSITECIQLIENLQLVPGRLEKVKVKKPFSVFVDFSHTPDALEKVLFTLHQMKRGKIITVFGCGGNRDAKKRPLMAKVSEKYSDLSIITNDNPRKEDPESIAKEIVSGFQSYSNYQVVLDRKEAIEHAIKLAKEDDIIVIAGKGHEKRQIFKLLAVDFDDVKCVEEACKH